MKITTMLKFALLPAVLLQTFCSSIKTEEVTYDSKGSALKGYIAYDAKITGKRPGIIIVHESWIDNEYAQRRARMLAEAGYTAMALEMPKDAHATPHHDESARFKTEIAAKFDSVSEQFTAAIERLKQHAMVDASRIGAIGYCLGGAVALNMARKGAALKTVVSFHGTLKPVQAAKKGGISGRLLVYQGGNDIYSPAEDTTSFTKDDRGKCQNDHDSIRRCQTRLYRFGCRQAVCRV